MLDVEAGRRACAKAAIAGAVALACGCSVAPYVCGSDDQCTLAGRDGHCEAVGYCSYPDADCPSGARFSDHAADEIAGSCVDDGLGTSASSGVPAGCGDGVQDGDELCDDGNELDGDGCNTDCRPSGEPRWTSDVAQGSVSAIARTPTRWIAVGSSGGDGLGSVSLAVAVDRDGAIVWGPLVEHGPGASRDARGVAAGTDDEVWIVGDEDGPTGVRAWAQRLASDGAVLDRIAFDTLVDDRFVTAASAATPIGGGVTEGGAWLHGLADPTWDRLVADHELRALASRDDGAFAALLVDGDGALFVHAFAPGGATIATSPSALAGATTLALARDGSLLSGAAIDAAVVAAKSDMAGTLVWSTTIPGGVALAQVLEHDDGDLALVGTQGEGGEALPWIARCDAAGSLRWQRTIDDAPGTRIAGATHHDDGGLVLAGTREDNVWLGAIAP